MFDSRSAGPEMKLHIEKIKALVLAGKDFDTVCRELAEYKKHTAIAFALQSVRNLANNGRINPAVAAVVGMLNIRINGDAPEGVLNPTDKVRGDKKAIAKLVENMKKAGYKGGRVFIDHCFNEAGAEEVKKTLLSIFPKAEIILDVTYGLWAGTAVNDTSSVVAAGYAYSEAAGDFATMVKLTRTLSIIPTVVIFALLNVHLKRKAALEAGSLEEIRADVKFSKLFPWFILGFLVLAVVNSLGVIPAAVSGTAKSLSKFLMVAALAAIGLNSSFKDMKKSGIQPMIHGFIISAAVVVVAIAVEYFMGLV